MTDPLSLDRFRALAEAYGAALGRWPEETRAPAAALLRDPVKGRAAAALLEETAGLDDWLDRWPSPAPDPALAARILAAAPRQPGRRLRLWWSALAGGVALAGAAAGSLAAAAVTAPEHRPPALVSTAFGDVAPLEAER